MADKDKDQERSDYNKGYENSYKNERGPDAFFGNGLAELFNTKSDAEKDGEAHGERDRIRDEKK